ncbi:hypothetical protein JYU34_018041 [Plutella xylostella]|uniref:Uncharacterized protein n=1 Tax=Plutella xylostella TaxID=51655 RepID=A0ABQ7PZK7_PLUXY|nr:hypothetical protein JYU34_018041 [Plutella xylostella]
MASVMKRSLVLKNVVMNKSAKGGLLAAQGNENYLNSIPLANTSQPPGHLRTSRSFTNRATTPLRRPLLQSQSTNLLQSRHRNDKNGGKNKNKGASKSDKNPCSSANPPTTPPDCPGTCLPPPCHCPPKCVQYMTGYFYYPYGWWYCGPYHQSACAPCGPVTAEPCPCPAPQPPAEKMPATACMCPGGLGAATPLATSGVAGSPSMGAKQAPFPPFGTAPPKDIIESSPLAARVKKPDYPNKEQSASESLKAAKDKENKSGISKFFSFNNLEQPSSPSDSSQKRFMSTGATEEEPDKILHKTSHTPNNNVKGGRQNSYASESIKS